MTDLQTPPRAELTAADILERFGPIPMSRVRNEPPPGTATEQDVIDIHDREGRACELVDGVILEKTMGWEESVLAGLLLRRLGNFVEQHKLGKVSGEQGGLRLWPNMLRVPDVAFVSRERLRAVPRPRSAYPLLVPELAVEVLSDGNTEKEMRDKLKQYFSAGVLLVWYVDPKLRTVSVHTSIHSVRTLNVADTLDGGDVLPGFSLKLADLFAELEEE